MPMKRLAEVSFRYEQVLQGSIGRWYLYLDGRLFPNIGYASLADALQSVRFNQPGVMYVDPASGAIMFARSVPVLDPGASHDTPASEQWYAPPLDG